MSDYVHAFVFAYGSMLNPDSLHMNLPELDYHRVRPAWLEGFERSWTAIFRIGSHSTSPPKVIPVAFLNIMPAYGKRINGALIPVGPAELAIIGRRETNYTRLDVTKNVSPVPHATVYAYSQNVSSTLYPRAMVAANYLRVVDEGLAHWGTGFTEDFRRTTMPNPYPVLEGDYHFLEDTEGKPPGGKL